MRTFEERYVPKSRSVFTSENESTVIRPMGVLVIEDDQLLRNLIARRLRKLGALAWTATNGQEGVELYRQVGLGIDLVLSDVQMPVLDGIATLHALRAIDPNVHCCFMTGDTRPATLDLIESCRPYRLFVKPFDVCEVVAALQELGQCPAGLTAVTQHPK